MYRQIEFLCPLVLIAALLTACSKNPYEKGKREAFQDLQQGKHIIKKYGIPHLEPDYFKEVLQRKYNIELLVVAGCEVTDELIDNVRGYNEVSQSAIEARYGEGFLEEVHIQAFEEYSGEIEARYGKDFLEAVRQQEYRVYRREKDIKEPQEK